MHRVCLFLSAEFKASLTRLFNSVPSRSVVAPELVVPPSVIVVGSLGLGFAPTNQQLPETLRAGGKIAGTGLDPATSSV